MAKPPKRPKRPGRAGYQPRPTEPLPDPPKPRRTEPLPVPGLRVEAPNARQKPPPRPGRYGSSRPGQRGSPWDLTEREMDVLELVAQDLTNKMIGSALFLSEDTIKTHLRRLYGKLGVSTRLGAVVAATARGIIPCHCELGRERQKRLLALDDPSTYSG